MSSTYELIIKAVDQTKAPLRSMESSLKKIEKRSASVNKALKGVGLALVAVIGTRALKGLVDVTSRFEDLRTTLDTVSGSAMAGGKAMNFLQDFATKTQFGVEDLGNAFIKLKGAGIEPTEKLLRTFSDTAAVTTDQIGTLQAITDLMARTTGGGLGLEELERLADRGIPVYKILSEEIGIARGAVSDFGKTAEGAAQLTAALLNGLDKKFGGATEARLNNLSTIVSNFQIAITKSVNAFGQGFSPALKEVIKDMTAFIDANTDIAKALGEASGSVLKSLASSIGDLAKNIGLLEPGALQRSIGVMIEGLGNFVIAFNKGITTAISGLANISNAIIDIQRWLPGGNKGIELPVNVTREEKIADLERFLARAIEKQRLWNEETSRFTKLVKTNPYDEMVTGANRLMTALKDPNTQTFQKIAIDSGNATSAVDGLGASLVRQGQALQQVGDLAERNAAINAQYPAYEDAVMRVAAAQERQAAATRQAAQEAAAAAAIRTQQQAQIEKLISDNERLLPIEQQLGQTYSARRALISQLNNELQTNTSLTDTQRTQLEALIAAATTEKNVLHERIKMGETLFAVQQRSTEALRLNQQEYQSLISGRNQVLAQMKSEQFQTESNRTFLLALNAAIAENRSQYAALTGQLSAAGGELNQFDQYYRNLVNTAREAVTGQTNMSLAVQRLNADLQAGKINLDTYAAAMQNLNQASVPTFDQKLLGARQRIFDAQQETATTKQLVAALTEEGYTRAQLEQAGLVSRATTRAAKTEQLTASQQLIKSMQDEQTQLVDLQSALGNVAALAKAAGVSEATLTKRLNDQIATLRANNGEVKSLAATIQEYWKSTSDSFASTLANDIMEGKNVLTSFKDFFKRTLKDIARMIIEQQITKPLMMEIQGLFGALGGGGGLMSGGMGGGGLLGGLLGGGGGGGLLGGLFSGGGFFSNIFSGIGGFFSNIFGGFFANGGVPPVGKASIVGERGPELFVPGSLGRVVPNDELNTGAGLNVTFQINAIDSRSGTEFILENKNQIVGVINDAYQRRGKAGVY